MRRDDRSICAFQESSVLVDGEDVGFVDGDDRIDGVAGTI
jgi:hypothetical protein